MSQTVVLEQTVETHTQSITLKFDDYASNTSNDANSKPDSENQSITIKSDDRSSNPIPIPNVDSQTEAAVNEFLRKHDSSDDEEVRTNARRDLRSFIDRLEIGTVLVLVKFASGVNNSELLDVLCEKVADVIKDKSVEEVREIFNITNDFTPEEEQAVRDEHPWAFED